jgi:hypothetical protein
MGHRAQRTFESALRSQAAGRLLSEGKNVDRVAEKVSTGRIPTWSLARTRV